MPIRPAVSRLRRRRGRGRISARLAAGASSHGRTCRPPVRRAVRLRPRTRWATTGTSRGASGRFGQCRKGCRTVTPYLHPKGAPAYIEFLKRAFGADRGRAASRPGRRVMHAQVRIGNAVLELGDPDPRAPMPTTFYLYVDDADALYHRAVAAGATPLAAACRQSYGDRVASVQDAIGTISGTSRGPRSKSRGRSLGRPGGGEGGEGGVSREGREGREGARMLS